MNALSVNPPIMPDQSPIGRQHRSARLAKRSMERQSTEPLTDRLSAKRPKRKLSVPQHSRKIQREHV